MPKRYDLDESSIRFAMKNTKSNNEAARFLKVAISTYKRYAKKYIDPDTGESLYDLHKNQGGAGLTKYGGRRSVGNNTEYLEKVFRGEIKNPPIYAIARKMIQSGYLEECCGNCGFEERRVTDYKIPLKLDFIDGDKRNTRRENIRLLCLNCYFLMVGDLSGIYAK